VDTVDPAQEDNNMMAQGQEGVEYQQAEYQQGVAEGGVAMEGDMVAAQVSGPQTLHVNIMNARGLYNADGFLAGKSDPYCLCVIPEKKHNKFQTKTLANTLDPDWNHTGLIHGFEAGDSLEFQVWDSDTFPKPDQLLGKVTLTPQDFANNPDGIQGVLQLGGGLSKESGTLEVRIVADVGATLEDAAQAQAHEAAHGSHGAAHHSGGGAQPGAKRLSAASQHLDRLQGASMAKLKVTVFGAAGLYNSDGFLAGKSDPYVICQVPENKTAQKFKTKVLKNTLDPKWNHLGVINSFVNGHTLEFLVYDSDTPPKPDQLLGKVVLTSEEFFPYGLEGSLILGESKAQGASLSVRIEVLPDVAATGLTGAKPASTHTYTQAQVLPSSYQYQTGQYQTGQYQSGMVYQQQQQPYVTTGGVQYVTGSPTYTYASGAPTTVMSQAVAQTAFNALDANHDGVITRSEFQSAVQAEPVAYQAAQPVATKVEYSAAPVTYMQASSYTQAAAYTAPAATYAAAPAVTYAEPTYAAAPAVTYVEQPSATTYVQGGAYTAPTMTYSAAPSVTYAEAPSAVTYAQAPAYAAPATTYAAAPSVTYAEAPSATTYMQTASYTAPTTTYAAAPATYMQAASTVIPAQTMMEPVAAPVTTVAGASSPKIIRSGVSMGSQPLTYSTAGQATYTSGMPASYTMGAQATYSTAAQGSPITIASAPTAAATMAASPVAATSTRFAPTSTMAAPRMSVASGSMATRVAYPGARTVSPGMAYTMAAPQMVTTAAAPPGQTLFDRIDKNHDGVITQSEFARVLR